MGTSVTPTQAAMASAASAEALAMASWPTSAAAPEYSARRSAAVSAVMERKKARTAGRSALAQSCAMVDWTLTAQRSQGDGNGLHNFAENGIGSFRFFLQGSVARAGDDAVRKNGNGKPLEIVREAIVAAIEKGAGLRGALKHQGAAGADTESKLFAFARAVDNFESVIVQAGVHLDVGDGILHGENFADVGDRIERIERIVANAFAQDFLFGFVRGIAHFDAHQKTVELRFGQGVGAVMLDGILRGDYEKWLGKWKRFTVDGDLRFVHGFEKRGLRARRSAVDFVGEDDVGENRSGTKFKFARFGIVDADAENIAGEQVRGELDALEAAMKRFCERLRESSFADAGYVFDEQVAAREKGDERELDGLFLAVDGPRDGALELGDDLRGGSRHVLKTRVLPVTNRWRCGCRGYLQWATSSVG